MQKADSFLKASDSQLGKLLKRAKQIDALDHLVKTQLDPALGKHCSVCNLKNGRLVLMTASAAIATRLKFEMPALLSALRKLDGFQELSGIDCKVSPKLGQF